MEPPIQSTAMDWPLSREEKNLQIIRLYNEDVRTADRMLSSGELALEALRDELDAVRRAAGIHKDMRSKPSNESAESPGSPKLAPMSPTNTNSQSEIERLRAAVESASAVLRAILPSQEDEGADAVSSAVAADSSRSRARSEGASREPAAVAVRPALCRTPRATKPRRKVSFGGQPEEEPAQVPVVTDSEEEDGKKVVLEKPKFRKHRDSMCLKQRIKGSADARQAVEDSESDAAPTPRSDKVQEHRLSQNPSMRVHLTWCVCSVGLALFCGQWAFQIGSSRTPSTGYGDPTCWHGGFRPEYCCIGVGGNPACWDHAHTYARCCEPNAKP